MEERAGSVVTVDLASSGGTGMLLSKKPFQAPKQLGAHEALVLATDRNQVLLSRSFARPSCYSSGSSVTFEDVAP